MNKGLIVSADSGLKVFKLKQGGGRASAKAGKAIIIDVRNGLYVHFGVEPALASEKSDKILE